MVENLLWTPDVCTVPDCFVSLDVFLEPFLGHHRRQRRGRKYIRISAIYYIYYLVAELHVLHLREDILKKSHIRETPTLSTDADSRTDTNLKRLRDLSEKNNFILF